MQSVLGTILDPAADKALMTTLTITLALRGLLPGASVSLMTLSLILTTFISAPLAVVIIGRDVLLSVSAFYIRYTSLPEPVRPSPLSWTMYVISLTCL
jgi:cardiolipin synthase